MKTLTTHTGTRRRQGRAGYTFVEAMVATMILVFVLGSVLGLAARGFRYIGDMRRWARSTQVLQQKMEDIRLVTLSDSLWALNNTTFNDSSVSGLTYRGTVTLAEYSPYASNNLANISITVVWTNSATKLITNRLTSLMCYNGLNKYIF